MAHDDIERSLGRMEGKIEAISTDLTEVKADVKSLNQFRWRVAGGAAILSFVLTGIVEVIHLLRWI